MGIEWHKSTDLPEGGKFILFISVGSKKSVAINQWIHRGCFYYTKNAYSDMGFGRSFLEINEVLCWCYEDDIIKEANRYCEKEFENTSIKQG